MLSIFKKKQVDQLKLNPQVSSQQKIVDSDKEVAAVISYALFLHLQEIHDYDNMVLTIQKVMRPYSPWSSKIYGLRQMPRR